MDLTPKYKRKAAVKLEKFPHYRSMHPSPTLSLCNRFKSIVEKYLTLLITGYLEEIYYAGQKAWHLARRQLVVTLFGRLCMSDMIFLQKLTPKNCSINEEKKQCISVWMHQTCTSLVGKWIHSQYQDFPFNPFLVGWVSNWYLPAVFPLFSAWFSLWIWVTILE